MENGQSESSAMFSRSGMSSTLGKCTEAVKVWLPIEIDSMSMTDRHHTMLRVIAQSPREARYFTNNTHDALSPFACAKHLSLMVRLGLVEVNEAGLYEATDAGHELVRRPPAEPRVFCNATMARGHYTGPAWNVRAGGADAMRLASRGTRC